LIRRVDEETLALDLIESVGPGGKFSDQSCADELLDDFDDFDDFDDEGEEQECCRNFQPKLISRAAREIWEKAGGKTLTQVANEKVRDIINYHEPEPLPKDLAAKIRDIVENAVGHMPGED
jgi:trimethylamine--corrinoid protein Co-methyltransferase